MTPDEQQVARRSADVMYAADLATRTAGITLVDIAPGRATVRMRIVESMINGHGTCHGGYLFLLADTAFGLACNSGGETTVAQACDIIFARPGHLGDELTATAVERMRFGRNGVCDVTLTRPDGAVVAEFRGRSRSLGTPLLPDAAAG